MMTRREVRRWRATKKISNKSYRCLAKTWPRSHKALESYIDRASNTQRRGPTACDRRRLKTEYRYTETNLSFREWLRQ